MGVAEWTAVGVCLITLLGMVIGYLLSSKDARQGKDIDLLFAIHKEDAEKLANLQLKIAEQHYPKSELDSKFQSLERTTEAGFKAMGERFDKLATALLQHITSDEKRGHD